jgi:hypothetical protein
MSWVREQIQIAFAEAIRHPNSAKEVWLPTEEVWQVWRPTQSGPRWELKGNLSDLLYAELLRIAGWNTSQE